MPASCSLKRHMLRCYQSVYPGCVCLFFIPIMHGTRFHTNQVHLQMSFLHGGLSDRRGGSEERCLLMRALKLMCPFGSSEGDLKKSETLSERPSHCPTADQSQSSTQIPSTLFRLGSTLECSLCFNSCSVRAG